MGCNGLQWENFWGITPPPPWTKLPWKSGLQWAAMGENFWGITPGLKLPFKSGLQWAAMGKLLRNNPPPLTKIAMKEWAAMSCNGGNFQELPPWLKLPCKGAAMGCNGRTFGELHPDWNRHLRVGCNGLQWAAMGKLLRNYPPPPPWTKLPWKSGLQWGRTFGELPPD